MSTSSLSDVLSPHLTQSSSQYIPIRPNARLDQHCALGAPIDSDAQGHDSASAESEYEHQYNHHPLRAHSLTEGSPAPRQSGRQLPDTIPSCVNSIPFFLSSPTQRWKSSLHLSSLARPRRPTCEPYATSTTAPRTRAHTVVLYASVFDPLKLPTILLASAFDPWSLAQTPSSASLTLLAFLEAQTEASTSRARASDARCGVVFKVRRGSAAGRPRASESSRARVQTPTRTRGRSTGTRGEGGER
ncbi:hypothetical protein C8Q76DRAFT_762218 [Earliella scabrosa]|nr:hypothetical protein C8Q76DRAFT_762218 [Earliella scabrosa]